MFKIAADTGAHLLRRDMSPSDPSPTLAVHCGNGFDEIGRAHV
jgi:hypothetical protein